MFAEITKLRDAVHSMTAAVSGWRPATVFTGSEN